MRVVKRPHPVVGEGEVPTTVHFLYRRKAHALFLQCFLILLVLSGLLLRTILMPNEHIWAHEFWFLSFEMQWFSLKSKLGNPHEIPHVT